MDKGVRRINQGNKADLQSTRRGGKAKKSLGQNFLVDPNVARKIVRCLQVQTGDRVLEIGPGPGALSDALLQSGARVVGVEKDLSLARELKLRRPDMDLIAGDARDVAWGRLSRAGIGKVIGNLPYNVASTLIWEVVSLFVQATGMVFTVQKEVGQRLAANPGTKEYGGLSVWVQNFVRPQMEFTIGPAVFRPRPRVDSAVVFLEPLAQCPAPEQCAALAALVRICFQKRRKQLKTSLRPMWSDALQNWFDEHGIRPQARAEELTPRDFLSLAQRVYPPQELGGR
ncbi:MAG: 16S rRNA (adenine(1518)-N(6)/adenine(1519)-N(6))-dimethyltransferase RsmA [Desulfovermiculus sp.]